MSAAAAWPLIFLVAALILFILAAINVNHPKITLGWAGLAFLTAYWLFFHH